MDVAPMTKWLNKELSALLECDVGDEYAKNILKIESESELREFIGSLLDLNKPANSRFLDELLSRIQRPSHFHDVTVYKKPDLNDTSPSKKKRQQQQQQASKEKASGDNQATDATKGAAGESTFSLVPLQTSKKAAPNRRVCECQASKHKLIGNCHKCGRIVCEMEGSGLCYFCGNLVCTREEMEKIGRTSKKSENYKAELMSRGWNGFDIIEQDLRQMESNASAALAADAAATSLQKAIEHKNKLIDYDRSSAKRTQVIDDESDYFNTNSKWTTAKQREQLQKKEEELREKRFGSRIHKTFKLDFAGRQIVDERDAPGAGINYASFSNEVDAILNDKVELLPAQTSNLNADAVSNITLQFVDQSATANAKKTVERKASGGETKTKKSGTVVTSIGSGRIQDTQLQEMRDDGMCLSMHQPWASLLVNGIKKHEGRTWYTPHRGRLWIHAGSKQPTELDIKELESFYKCFYADQQLKMPTSYPTSCLLGYVDLSDCMSSEDYKEEYPNGESQSEYVFICEHPRELLVKLPMAGQHKIFKLDKMVHMAAKKAPVRVHD